MSTIDYFGMADGIAMTVAKVAAPLTNEQFLALAGALGVYVEKAIASQASPAPVPDEQAPHGWLYRDEMEKWVFVPGERPPSWPWKQPTLTAIYTRPVAAEKREPHTSEQRARPDRFVPSPDGRSIDDDDFIYDATLKVTGDFADDATRHSYARWICDRLNAGGTHPSTGEDA